MIHILEPFPKSCVHAFLSLRSQLLHLVESYNTPFPQTRNTRDALDLSRVSSLEPFWEQEHSSLETIGAIYLPFTPICKPPRWGATPTFGSTLCCSSNPRRGWNHTPFFQPGARDQQNIEEHLRLARCGLWNIRDQSNLDAQPQRPESEIATLSE